MNFMNICHLFEKTLSFALGVNFFSLSELCKIRRNIWKPALANCILSHPVITPHSPGSSGCLSGPILYHTLGCQTKIVIKVIKFRNPKYGTFLGLAVEGPGRGGGGGGICDPASERSSEARKHTRYEKLIYNGGLIRL